MTRPCMAAIGLVALGWAFTGCRPAARRPERPGAIRIGLDANPFDPNNNYYPYNWQQKQADFEYVALKSLLGGDFSITDKAYTYAYNNDSHEKSADPVVGGTTNFPGKTTVYTGPIANALGGADLSIPVGFAVSALVYWALARTSVPAEAAAPSDAGSAAALAVET